MIQIVMLMKGGEPVKMGKRTGNIVLLRELREEVGNDACRFFYLLRSHEQNLEFDLDLATKRASDNPVFYVQYAHARVASVLKEVGARGFTYDKAAGLAKLALLDKPSEAALIKELSRFTEVVEQAAANYTPHSIVYYLRDVANAFHTYYQAEKWIAEDADLRNARLALVEAAGQTIRNGLALLGVSAPESM